MTSQQHTPYFSGWWWWWWCQLGRGSALLGRLHQETAPLELLSRVETTFSCVSPSPWAATGWNARCFVYTISKGAGALISIKTVIELNYLYDCPLELLSMLFSSPHKKSMWGEYNAGSPDTTKGHCIRKPYLCCVTFGCAGEVGWIPADTQSAPVRGTEWILNVWFEVPTSASAPANGTLLFSLLRFWMLGAGGRGAKLCVNLRLKPWMWLRCEFTSTQNASPSLQHVLCMLSVGTLLICLV